MEAIETLQEIDDEMAWIASVCSTEAGIDCIKRGNLTKAMQLLAKAQAYAHQTCYPTETVRARIALYTPVAENLPSPLLEFDEPTYRALCEDGCHTEFYKYLMQDISYEFQNTRYADHMRAKVLIRERRYSDAKDILHRVEMTRSDMDYDAFLFFGIYTDLELCYKELYDFEQAYRYANKRMSLLASFRS